MALIAFQNNDIDELFNFYDTRNKLRLSKVSSKTKENFREIEYIKRHADTIFKAISGAVATIEGKLLKNLKKRLTKKKDQVPKLKLNDKF